MSWWVAGTTHWPVRRYCRGPDCKVLVAERNSWLGGGAVTQEITLPGYKSDLFGSNHVWIHANPQISELMPELEQFGLKYLWADDEIMGHPMEEGPGIIVFKDVDKTCDSIAEYSGKRCNARYREIHDGFVEIKDGFVKNMFSPPCPARVICRPSWSKVLTG